jgi:hypothetical protein
MDSLFTSPEMPQKVTSRNALLKSIGVFVLLFVFLSLPWQGLQITYTAWFRAIGTMVFSRDNGPRDVVFLDHPRNAALPTMIRIEIANRQMLGADGSGPVRHLDLDVQGFALMPTILLISLILATPFATGSRILTLLFGCLIMQLVVIGFLGMAIWIDSAEIGLAKIPPEWKTTIASSSVTLITNFSIAAPIAIWLLLCFHRIRKG